MKSKHIEIRSIDSKVEVLVDDYELFDYVDDLFTEKGIEYEFTSEELRGGRKFHKMHFGEGVKEAELAEVIDAISQEEIERTWTLNNPG